MEVILFETVANLGVRGNICQVRPGYFRNFLSPRGMAVEATAGNVNRLQDKIKKLEREAEEEVKEARTEAEKLNDLTLNFEMKCGESGKLFGSVTNMGIAEKLKEAGFEIDRHKIVIPNPIKDIGEHPILIKVHHHVSATISILVEPDEDSKGAVERLALEKEALATAEAENKVDEAADATEANADEVAEVEATGSEEVVEATAAEETNSEEVAADDAGATDDATATKEVQED